MNYASKQKLVLRQLMRSCFSLFLALAFIANSFLPGFAFGYNKNLIPDNLTYNDLSLIAYGYKTVLNEDIPKNQEIFETANEINSKNKHITLDTVKSHLSKKVKNNIYIKSKLIEEAYQNKYQKVLPKGTALTLTNNQLANNNSYESIYKSLEKHSSAISYKPQATSSNLIAQADTDMPETTSEENKQVTDSSPECNVINLELFDFYKASPQIKAKLEDPFSSITWSALSGSQSRFSALDHSLKNNKLAWSLLGYPTSFGLTYNGDGKFINITTSASAVNSLIGSTSDIAKLDNALVLGGFLPQAKFNTLDNEYYTVGAPPNGNEKVPYLYAFDTEDNKGVVKRSKDTYNHHYSGFSHGLDVTPNGLILLGIEDGNLTAALKEQNKAPLSIKNINQLRQFTKSYTNYFEVDDQTTNNPNHAFAIAGYVLPDTFKYSEILSLLKNNEISNYQSGLTIFSIDQSQENKEEIKILNKADFWGKELKSLLGFENTTVGGYAIKDNKLYISYFINNGVDFKKFYEANYQKYIQQGKSWVDSNTGLPPSAFKYKDGLYDTRLAVFNLAQDGNTIKLDKIADISTVFDNPHCSGDSYGVSGPVKVSKNDIFIADKTYAGNVVRVFRYDPSSVFGIVPANIPYVIKLSNPRVENVLSESKYKPLAKDFVFSTSISDIAVDPESKILFVSLPFIEQSSDGLGKLHINGLLGSVYLSNSTEKCSKIVSSENCSEASTSKDEEDEETLKEESSEEDLKTQKTIRQLSISEGSNTPSFVVDVNINPLEFSPSNFADKHHVDLDVTSAVKSSTGIKISANTRGGNSATILKFDLSDDPYFPQVSRDVVKFNDSFNLLSRDGSNTYGKSTAIAGDGETLLALTNDDKVSKGFISSEKITPLTNIENGLHPRIVSSNINVDPKADEEFIILSQPPDNISAKPDSLIYVFKNKNRNPVEIEGVLGNIEDQGFSVPIVLDGPNFNIKYKSNNFQISDVKNINNPNEKVGLLTYRNSLKSEAISSYFKQILNIFPGFTEDPLNTDNFLKTFNGFSLVGIPEKADNISNTRTYTNFYFDKLLSEAPQLAPPNNIADAILFSNNNDLYLAVSSYIPELASEVSTQEDPDSKDTDVPTISTKNLKLRFDAGNYNGKGGNAKDASFAGSLKWTDIANSGFVGNLINSNAKEAWVGKGITSDPYSLELTNPGSVSVTAAALDKLRSTNSFEAQGIINLYPNRSGNINIFSWGAELALVIDKDNNIIVTHNGVTKNTGAKISTKEWHQISFGKSVSDVFTVYLDNELVWSAKTTSFLDRSRSTLIGGGVGQDTKWKLATFRVYSEILTEKEREDNYTSDLYIYNEKSKVKELKAKKGYDTNCGIKLDTQLNEYISLESKSTVATRRAQYAQVQPSPGSSTSTTGGSDSGSSSSETKPTTKPTPSTTSSKSTAVALNPGTSPYTVSTYVKINEPEGSTALGDGTVIFTNRDSYSADSITVGTLGGKAYCLRDGPEETVGAQGNTQITDDGKFHHVVCVRDGTKYQVWVDGINETNEVEIAGTFESSAFDFNNTAPIKIGKHGDWGSNLGNFEISDLKIFKKALSKEEIIELGLNLSSLPKSAKTNLLSWCKFNEATKNPTSCWDTDSFGNVKLNSALEAAINGAKLPKCQKASGSTVKLTDGAEGLTIKKITVAKSYTVNKSLVIPFSVESENGGVTITAEKPDWASISFDTKELIGTISGVPKEINTYEIKIIATDKKSLKTEQTISIDVIKKNNTGVNNPPEIKSPGNQTIVEKRPFSFLIPFSDPDGDDVEVSLYGLPSNAGGSGAPGSSIGFRQATNLKQIAPVEDFGIKVDDRTGIVSGPAKGIARYKGKQVNTYTVTATATDERGEYAETTFDITFINKNQPPVLLNKIDNLNIDDLKEFSTKALVASDPDGDKLIFKLKTVGNLPGNDYGFGGYGGFGPGFPGGGGYGSDPGDDDYFGGGFSGGGYGEDEGDPADKFDLNPDQQAGGICGSFDGGDGNGGGGGQSGRNSGGNNSNGGASSPRIASTKHLSNYRYQIYPGGGDYSGGDSYSGEGDNSNGGSYSGGDSGSSDDGTPTDPSGGAPGVPGGGSSSGNDLTSGPSGSPFEDSLISQLKDLGINYDRETGKFSGKTNFRVNPKKPRLLLKPVVIEADDGDYFDTNDKKVQENKETSFEIAVETKNNPPQITENPGDISDFKEKNNDLYVKVKAIDKDGNKITYKIKGLPKTFDNNLGLSFNSETGELTGKPDGIIDIIRKDKAKVDLTVVANDGLEDSGEAKFSITFVQNNIKPKLVQQEDVKFTSGQNVNIRLSATDEDDEASSFTYYISCIPTGLIFDEKNGTITGIASLSGDKLKEEYDIEVYAGDGHFNGYTDKDKFKYTVEKTTAKNKLYAPYEIAQGINLTNNLICSLNQIKNNIQSLRYKPLLNTLKSLNLNEKPKENIINKQPHIGHKEKFFSTTLPPNIQNSGATFNTSDTNRELFLDGACYQCIPKEYKFDQRHIIPAQADTTPPTVSSLSPADNATNVSTTENLVITFSEAVNPQAGVNNDIIIKKTSDNSTVETIDAQALNVSGGSTSTITIDPNTTLTNSTSYYIQIGADAFDDLAGNSYAGISATTTWDFTTDSTAPTVSSLSPLDNATNVSTTSSLVITFSEAVNPQAGVNNDIIIKKTSDNSTVETIDAQALNVTGGGTSTITIDPNTTLTNSTSYYVQIGADAFDDLAGLSYAGISATTTWDFTTDSTAPTVSSLSPLDNAINVSITSSLVITFSEAVNPQAGVNNDIIIKKTSDNSTVETIDAQAANVSGGGTSIITIDPSTILANSTSYYIQIGADAFDDLATISYAGISDTTSWNFTTEADTTAPTISSLSPANGATGVSGTANLVITFSEAVNPQAGVNNDIIIKKTSDNSTVETIDAQDAKVTGGGTTTITINPAATLASSTSYYVQIGADAFDDLVGNSYAGISDTTTWNFTIADTTAPTVSSLSPADNAINVSNTENLVITFSEEVNPQAGVNNDIIIKKTSDNSTVETIDAQDFTVSGGGTTTITIDPATSLANSTSYYIQIGADAFDDLAGNSYAGISTTTTWDFTTAVADTTAPTVSMLSPADNATNVSITSNLVITFSEAVNPQAGVNNDIIIKKTSDNSTVETIDAQALNVSGGGTSTITIDLYTTLTNSTSYYVQIGADAFDDLAGNSYAGISTTTTWNFTTDSTAPTVSSLSPADNATNVSTTSSLVITFSEAVNPQAGVNNDIIIKKTSDNSTIETIDAQYFTVSGGGTSTITIDLVTTLANLTSYYVQIGADAFDDLAGLSYAGISTTTTWNFTTGAVCGNSIVESGEQCDDGNGINNDSCTNGCMNAVCMDSIVQDINGETCDDGNSIEGDGCNNACMTEVGGGGGPAPESTTSTSTSGSSSTSSTSSSTSTTTGGSSTTSTGGTTMTTTGSSTSTTSGSTSTSTSSSTSTSGGGSSSTSGGKDGTSTGGGGGKVNTCSFPTSDDDYNSIGQSGTSSTSTGSKGGGSTTTSTSSPSGGGGSTSTSSTTGGGGSTSTSSPSGGGGSTSTSSTTSGGGTALPPPPTPEDTPGGFFFFRESSPQITGKAQVDGSNENPCSKCINRVKDLGLLSDASKCTQCFACEKDCKIKEYFEGGTCNVCCEELKSPDNIPDRLIVQLDPGNIDTRGKQPPDAAREKVTNWNSLKGNHVAILNNFDFDSRGNWVGDGSFNAFALLFNGLKNYVSLPSTATKGLAENNIVTIETWIRLNKNNIGNFYIFSRGNLKLGINSKSNITVEDKDTNVKVESNKWTHIVFIKDRANSAKLYLNSQETKWSEKINYIKEDPTTSIIGAGPNKDSGFLSGQIGYLNIYNHALTKKDIEGIYTTSRTRFPEFDLLSEDDDKKDEKAGTLAGIIDNIPPGIKVDFNENTEYQAGDIIAATVVDELSPEGSNPAKNISSIGCILGGLNVDIEKEKNIIQKTSGVTLTKSQTLEFPGSLGDLQYWTIEALVKRRGAIASAPAGNATAASDEFIIKGSTNILIDGKTQSLKINDLSTKSVFLPNQWNYLLITCDGANTKIYLNNVLEAIGPKIDLNLSNAKVGENFEGELAFIRLYNEGFISQDRIDRHYRYRFEPYNKSGLTYQLNFDGGPGYKWDIQSFKFTIPKFSKERPEKQRNLLLCSLNDVYGNKVSDELQGRILISNIIDEEEDKGKIIKTEKPSCDGSVVKCQEKDAKAECLLGNVKCQATEVKKKLEFIPHCCRKTSTGEETCIPNDPTALCKLPEDAKGKSSGNDAGSSTSKKDDGSQGKQEEFTVTKTNENPLIKSSIFLKKVACKQSQRNFVVTGKEALTGQDVDYAYRSTKLTIYKVIQNKDTQASDAFSLKLETEKETSREVPDKCTKPLRAGLAGLLNWNPLTETLTLVDQHGLNLGVEYKVSFNNDGIKLKELNELNFAPAYDGYVSSTINTQAFDKHNTNYFLIAKPNDKNYNYNILAYSIVDETKFEKKSDKDKKGKATNIDKKDDDKGKSASDDNNQTTTQIIIGGGGLFDPNANPFGGDDKADQEKAESAKGEKGKADQGLDKAKDKSKDKTEKDKDDEEDIKDQTDKMESSSSSGGYSSSSSSGGKQEECLESSECTGDDAFCLDVNGKGKCINNPKEKISNQGYKRTGQCLEKEIKIEGRKKGKSGELYCVRTRASIDTNGKKDKELEIKSGKDTTEQKEDAQRAEPPKKITPRDQIPQLIQDHGINEKTNKVYNSRGHPNNLIGLANYSMNNKGSLKYKLRDPSSNMGDQDNKQDIIGSKFEGFIDGAYFTEYSGVLNNNIKNVQFNREEQSCKNYVDCKYGEGYFCLGNSKDDKTGTCKFVCNNGKISEGIDSKGKSLPCADGLFDSGLTDLSGRSICCTTKLDKDKNLLARGEATGCKNSVDCQKGEFCSYDNEIKNSTVCAFFNCNNSIVAAINCPKTPIEYFLLAGGPEGKLCCPISEIKTQTTSSSGGEGISSSGEISSSSSGEIVSSSSSGMAPSSSSGSSSSSSSSSSGSSSSSSSSGYFILLVLNTPEIYSTSLKEREANLKERGLKGKKADLKAVIIDKSTNIQQGSTLQSNINIQAVQEREKGLHTYYGGELVSFTISLKGPIGADPQDVESYEISVVAAEKTGQTDDDPYIANLVPFEIRPKDIVSTTNINNFFRNPPPLYASLIREDSKGVLRAARGDIFRFTLPDARYLTKDKSTKLQILKPSVDEIVPELGCSSKGGAVCGNEVGVCLAHECYHFTKGSLLGKACCNGELPENFVDSLSTSSSGGEAGQPSPQCDTKTSPVQIYCKSTHINYVPYCDKRLIPECDGNNPSCKARNNSSSSGGNEQKVDPKCVSLSERTRLYCDEVKLLEPKDGNQSTFSAADCVRDNCDYVKSLDKKLNCCKACGAAFDKITNEDIDSYEEEQILSCISYEANGICGNKGAESCIVSSCYKLDQSTEEFQTCCLKLDKEATRVRELIKQSKTTEDKDGAVYNIITFKDDNIPPAKIRKSDEDLVTQIIDLLLPSDPQVGRITINAVMKYREKNKTKTNKAVPLKIALVPGKVQKDETIIAREKEETAKTGVKTCNAPIISSLKVADKGIINTEINLPIEIPVIVTDPDNDIDSVTVSGGGEDFEITEQTKDPSYNFTSIAGTPTTAKKQTFTVKATDTCGKSSSFTFDIQPLETKKDVIAKGNEEAESKDEDDIPKVETPKIGKAWLPTVPIIQEKPITITVNGNEVAAKTIELQTTRAAVTGSRLSLELTAPIDVLNLNPDSLKVIWVSAKNEAKEMPPRLELLANGIIKLTLIIDKNEPEGTAKIIVSSAKNEKNILAQSEVNIIKSLSTTSLSEKPFGALGITKATFHADPTNKQIYTVVVNGKNFIGKRAKISGTKVIVPKKNNFGLFDLTVAEFRNNAISITRTFVMKENTELIIVVKLPEGYSGAKEELFISTPVGQAFTEIELPPVK